jgi:hypothetical protein
MLAGLALYLASKGNLGSDVSQVLWLLSGMFVAGFFHSFGETSRDARPVRALLTFDPELSRRALDKIVDADFVEVENREVPPSWELTSNELLLRDPNLAMARLRIDLERELRRLSSGFMVGRPMGLSQMMSVLIKEGVIPAELASAIRDITPIANDAVHGAEVPLYQARKVLELGDEVLRHLRNIPESTSQHVTY